jgi:hypothetical protein
LDYFRPKCRQTANVSIIENSGIGVKIVRKQYFDFFFIIEVHIFKGNLWWVMAQGPVNKDDGVKLPNQAPEFWPFIVLKVKYKQPINMYAST